MDEIKVVLFVIFKFELKFVEEIFFLVFVLEEEELEFDIGDFW